MPISKTIWLTLFIIAYTVYPLTTIAADWQGLVQQGDELYGKRAEENGEKYVRDAVLKYEEALKEIPDTEEKTLVGIYIKLSRSYFTLAEYFAKDDDDESDLSDKGQNWADKALDADPKSAEAHYWMGANLGLWRSVHKASFRGGLTGGGIKKEFKEAIGLDPNGLYGMPYMRLAEFELASGSPQDAQNYAEKSVEIGPNLMTNRIILAEILWEQDNKTESKKVLEYIAAQKDDILPSEVLENRDTIKRAQRILGELNKGQEPDW